MARPVLKDLADIDSSLITERLCGLWTTGEKPTQGLVLGWKLLCLYRCQHLDTVARIELTLN
jgi:hypothetical protein